MFKTDKAPGFYIYYTNRLYDNNLNQMFKAKGIDINTLHWSTLNQILLYPGLTQRELALKCFRDPSSITKTLDALEKKGLVTRESDTTDRRAFRIYITDKGIELHDKVAPIAQEFMDNATENITEEELEVLYSLLSRIALNILNKDDITLIE